MGERKRKTFKPRVSQGRLLPPISNSNENKLCIWTFENIDRAGKFRFDPKREDFDAAGFLQKLISFSNMTWREIRRQTHDDGKSKHHSLSASSLSKEAMERIKAKKLEDLSDHIFSFALNNLVRVIGIRDPNGSEFRVIWYDTRHEFSKSEMKHT